MSSGEGQKHVDFRSRRPFPAGMATKSGQQDVGHAIVATGRGALRLPRRKNRAPPGFSAHAIPAGVAALHYNQLNIRYL